MRSRIMVIGRDAQSRGRLARLVTSGGYRAEVAESIAHARRAGLKGIALAILAPLSANPSADFERRPGIAPQQPLLIA